MLRSTRCVVARGRRWCTAGAEETPPPIKLIKEIRGMTGAGMMDCRTALMKTGCDLQAALKWLEEKGVARAGKKKGRAAAAGAVAVAEGTGGTWVFELNSESDFVAKTQGFGDLIELVRAKAPSVAAPPKDATPEDLASKLLEADGVSAAITTTIATTGENVTLRRAAFIETPAQGGASFYIHNKHASAPGAGLTCALVALAPENVFKDTADAAVLEAAARQVAMHIVSESLSENTTPLREQLFMQSDKTVGGFLKQKAKAAGCKKIEIAETLIWVCGEGVEVQQANFADEVASMAKAGTA